MRLAYTSSMQKYDYLIYQGRTRQLLTAVVPLFVVPATSCRESSRGSACSTVEAVTGRGGESSDGGRGGVSRRMTEVLYVLALPSNAHTSPNLSTLPPPKSPSQRTEGWRLLGKISPQWQWTWHGASWRDVLQQDGKYVTTDEEMTSLKEEVLCSAHQSLIPDQHK